MSASLDIKDAQSWIDDFGKRFAQMRSGDSHQVTQDLGRSLPSFQLEFISGFKAAQGRSAGKDLGSIHRSLQTSLLRAPHEWGFQLGRLAVLVQGECPVLLDASADVMNRIIREL
jgi:hypothetical protein